MTTSFNLLQGSQALLKILIFSFVTVMIWVGFSIFRSQQGSLISPELQTMAKPLNPVINIGVIQKLEQKKVYSPEELSEFAIYRVTRDSEGNEVIVTE